MIHLFERLELRAMAPRNTQVREGSSASRRPRQPSFVRRIPKERCDSHCWPTVVLVRAPDRLPRHVASTSFPAARSPHEWHVVSENNIAPGKGLAKFVIVD